MSEPTAQRLKVSREGIVLIKSFEGFRPRAVRDADGGWVIGYGHTASAREGLTVGEQDAELLLQYDLMPVVKALNERIAAPLNQHQFDALASFAVSVGVDCFLTSDVLREMNAGHAGEAADALIGWPENAAPDSRLRRRAAERALFVADPSHAVHLAELLSAPLPPPPVEAAPEPVSTAETRAAAVASLLGEPAVETPATDPAPVSPTSPPVSPQTLINLQRFSPYSTAFIGALPGFPPLPVAESVAGPEVAPEVAPVIEAPLDVSTAGTAESIEPEPPAAPAEPDIPVPFVVAAPVFAPMPPVSVDSSPFSTAPEVSPFPPLEEPLVLTPATETDFPDAARQAWTPEERPTPHLETDETVLFEDEPTQSVLRHEVEPGHPRRFDWNESGAFLGMGIVGLIAFGASAAAFRLSVDQPSPMGETTVLAWALALIGVICVGVSSWNLYVRWGRGK